MKNLSNLVEVKLGAATTAAGTTTVNGSIIDMQDFEGLLIVAQFGTAAANNTIKAQQDTDPAGATMADLAGTSVGVGASDEIVWLDIFRPQKRYVRAVVLRGTSTTIDSCMVYKYGAKKKPTNNKVAGTIHGELWVSPAEGTA